MDDDDVREPDCSTKWSERGYGIREKDIVSEGRCNEYFWVNKLNDKEYAMRNTTPIIRNMCSNQEGIFGNLCKCRRLPLKKCLRTDGDSISVSLGRGVTRKKNLGRSRKKNLLSKKSKKQNKKRKLSRKKKNSKAFLPLNLCLVKR